MKEVFYTEPYFENANLHLGQAGDAKLGRFQGRVTLSGATSTTSIALGFDAEGLVWSFCLLTYSFASLGPI